MFDNEPISVGIVNHNIDKKILELCITSILFFSQNLFEIIVVDNGSRTNDWEKTLQHPKIRIIKRKQIKQGASFGSGEGHNVLKNEFKTRYCAFVENDGLLLCDKWDRILIEHLKKENKVIVGCEYPNKPNKVSTGAFVTFSVFDNDKLKERKIDYMPNGIGPNFTYGNDVGWEIMEKIKDKEASKLSFCTLRNKDAKIIKIFGCAEYQFEGLPIFAHFGRGSHRKSFKLLKSEVINLAKSLIYLITFDLEKYLKSKASAIKFLTGGKKKKKWVKLANKLLNGVMTAG